MNELGWGKREEGAAFHKPHVVNTRLAALLRGSSLDDASKGEDRPPPSRDRLSEGQVKLHSETKKGTTWGVTDQGPTSRTTKSTLLQGNGVQKK